ncbi:MAG: PTS-dependent dihydroxyacetone kinase phosphotransferase subunit DhaM, partial [Caldilineaceae bacterium]
MRASAACVNLVIVSHSALVAEGVREIACQMAGDQVQIGATGGLRDAGGRHLLGTDAEAIAAVVRHVWSPRGVLLLV